jgi:hypothetical protein
MRLFCCQNKRYALFQADSLIAMIFTGNKTRWGQQAAGAGQLQSAAPDVFMRCCLPESMIFTLFIRLPISAHRRHRKKTHSIEMA